MSYPKNTALTLQRHSNIISNDFDFNELRTQVVEEIKADKPLFGKNEASALLLEYILNTVLEGKMNAHLTENSHQLSNYCNGKMHRRVQAPMGEMTI